MLSAEERAWIRRHPILLVGTGNEWPPYDFRKEGEYRGLARDYLDLVSKKVGLGFDYSATDTWAGLQEQLRQGKIDLLPAIYWDEGLQGELLFTDVYVEAKEFVFVREGDHALKTLEDLDGRTAVFVRGSNTLPVLKKMFPSLRIIEVATLKEAVRSLTDHNADFCIDTFGAITHISEQLGLTGIKAAFPVDLIDTGLRMAIKRSNPVLFSILQKGLKAVTGEEREEIERRWLGATEQDRHKKVLLSQEEQNWIKAHPVITVAGDPNRPPLSFYDQKGLYAGILGDYLDRIQNRTGMRFAHRHLGSFAAALEAMKRGEIDLLDAAAYSSERLNLMDFSTEHLRIDHVIVTTKDKPVIPRIDELADREVGVVQGHLVENKLPKDVPDIRLRAFIHAEEGLKELSQGRLEAFVIDLPTLDFLSQKLGLSNLKVSGGTPYSYALYFGLRKKTPMLRTILNKALASIDLSERNEIYRRWVAFEYEAEIDYGLLWRTAAILLLIMAATLYWNRRLSREIAKRIILEKELVLAKERAEKATLAKSEFLANMSHEIRTPMNSVIGFADILDGLTDDPLQKSYLHSIKIGGKALLGIINDILDLSKIEAGQIKLSCENVSIPLLCSETQQLFHEKMVRKNLKFILEIDPEIPPYVFLDGVRLRQILINLVGNAVKFTDQGSVSLAARRIDRVSPPGKLDIEIRVTDTGIGIPEENRERIFQTFEQREGQDIRKYGGSGLGLSISRKLVALMNGEITVESVVGRGSVFILTLHDVPFEAAGPEHKKAVQEQAVVAFEAATLMIVDDMADNRKLVEACFRDTPVAVVEAVHGKAALETLERVMVDLVLMDLRMPVMNGYETLSRLRQDQRFKGLPIVALTASVMGEDFENIERCGFNGYLRKPVEKKKLLEEAARFLPHRRIQKTSPPEEEVLSFPSVAVRDALADRLGGELLDEWNRVREGGDVESIRLFNGRLKAAALQNDVQWLITYSDRLAACIASFDLAEIFLLMNQYPDIVAKVKTAEVSADGR